MGLTAATRANLLKFSAIRAVAQKAEALSQAGRRIIDLSLGRPDFDTPDHIKAAAKQAIDEGKVHYTSNYGILELRQALARKFREENGLEYSPDEIIVTTGAVEALAASLMSFLEPGDEVVILEPSWVNYVSLVHLCGGQPILVGLRGDRFSLIGSDIATRITPKTKAILLATPNNPTGTVLDEDALWAVARAANEHDLLVVADEVYEKIVYDDAKHVSIASLKGMRDRTITCGAVSKTYSMTGWRIGYLVGDEKLISSVIKVHQSLVTCANAVAQWAALAAVTGPQQCVGKMLEEFGRRRSFLMNAFDSLSPLRLVVPKGTFFAFIDVRGLGMTSLEASEFLLESAGVGLVPGSAFGPSGEGYLRLSFASSQHLLEEAVENMREALRRR